MVAVAEVLMCLAVAARGIRSIAWYIHKAMSTRAFIATAGADKRVDALLAKQARAVFAADIKVAVG